MQLFIDVSSLVGEDLKTGIQRVVRSVLVELLSSSPASFSVEPVFIVPDGSGRYLYARQFIHSLLSHETNPLDQFTDSPVEVGIGDIFIGLDLHHNIRPALKFFESIRTKGGRVYFVVYDLLPLLFPHYFPPGVEAHHHNWMSVVAEGDGLLCISRSVADDVKRWFDRVQPPLYYPFSIGWFHLGADIEHSLPTTGFPKGFDRDLQKFAATTTILMVGTVEPRKGHAQALKAFELLWNIGINSNLVIVGKKGWMVEKLAKRLLTHKELNHRLFWYQGISDEALKKLYAAADGMLLASEGEGFGLPLVEAAQHNCPVLARDLPVFLEVAGLHATYFKTHSPLMLAMSILSWVNALRKGSAPQSSAMPWLSWKECTASIIILLTDKSDPNWVYQLEPNAKTPKCIAVDLTLVQPGGDNGGAKVFMLELLRMLARMKPATRFIILTRQSSHDELAFLDCLNMQRVMTVADLPPAVSEESKRQDKAADPAVQRASWIQRTLKRWKRSIQKRTGKLEQSIPDAPKTLLDMGVDLLYCPFTSLEHAEPGIPSVCTIYDLQYKTYPEFFPPEEVAHRDKVFMDACRYASGLAAISEYSRQSALRHGDLDPSRIRMISLRMANRILPGNNLDDRRSNELFDRLGIEKKKYFLYPANFWQHKNHEMLLTAFSLAITQGLPPEIKLVCTGAPTERQKAVIDKAQSMELLGRVIFPGYLPNDELALLLSQSIGMIFPSLYEGFGMPVIEAMAAGVPVACSNTHSLPEVTGGAALMFNPESPEEIAGAMVSLAGNEALRSRLVKAGLVRALEFADQERMAREYWELFEEAMLVHHRQSILA